MSYIRKRGFWPVLALALALSAIALASSRKSSALKPTATRPPAAQNPHASAGAKQTDYVRRAALRPQLIRNLNALGDRLERPGKERLTITGTLNVSSDAQPKQVVAVLEFPDRLRLTVEGVPQARVIVFDGHRSSAVGSPLEPQELDLVETLIYDAAEHFFATQGRGTPTRFLGERFRTDDGSAANYAGPFYDVYQVGDQVSTAPEAEQRPKIYYFNSDTLLLERVRYQVERGGSPFEVETVLGDWKKEQGQQVPHRVERFEDGRSVFTLTVSTAALGPRADDGIF